MNINKLRRCFHCHMSKTLFLLPRNALQWPLFEQTQSHIHHQPLSEILQTMADVTSPEACRWTDVDCRHKGEVKSERLPLTPKPKPWRPSAPLLSPPLFSSGCSGTANNNFLFLDKQHQLDSSFLLPVIEARCLFVFAYGQRGSESETRIGNIPQNKAPWWTQTINFQWLV